MVKEEIIIICPHCEGDHVYRNGKDKNGKQRYRCQDKACSKNFITNYDRKGCRLDIKKKIVDMAMNGSGIRDTSRVLGISPVSVIKELRAQLPNVKQVNEMFLNCDRVHIELESAQADEQWSYVKQKDDQAWLWYAIDSQSGKVLAWHIGARTDESFLELWTKLKDFNINQFCTDNWSSYKKYIPSDKHKISKKLTQKIERKNLDLRTRIKRLARKTICFSKDEQMHWIVIGLFITKFLMNHT